ncbi:nucleotidyltransferase family protein [Tenacibaculum soleae]|uniref:nucleotidyltransferase family protein n=1 Tax=Tenacibaculum soleae TaxID=447689 RepID=UPI0026E2AACD|nr:nucleotidyltransferase family protein [Tenacibaculum soleae]MDO6744889.1 nucleotidyltransferase family protein [Tenacibaculum soleae]
MMNYKNTLLFIGKCLTITHEKHNRELIEKELKLNNIDWDSVVKVSTSHYVFPALYCNLKRAKFLHYLPKDLVDYMKHITDLNRERNQQIITEAKGINELLLSNKITPIFLKGAGNLLDGLYDDIAERMVGDIDFLVEKEKSNIAFKILQKNGYTNKVSELFNDHRHLPRITHPAKIAAIEIHKEMLRKKKSIFFNYETVKSSLKKVNNITLLSLKNQIKLTVFSKLINDYNYQLKNISLRATYDIFLLGNKLQSKINIKDNNLSKELIAGLNLYTSISSKPENLYFYTTKQSELFTKKAIQNLDNTFKTELNYKTVKFYIWLKERATILTKTIYNKSYFLFVFSKLTDIKWYKRKLSL